MKISRKTGLLAATVALATTISAIGASAATVTFGSSGWVNEQNNAQDTQWTVVIDDAAAAPTFDYRFSINYAGGANIGSILGFATEADLDFTGAMFNLVSSDVTTTLGTPCIGTDIDSCGSGLNWNGGGLSNPGGFDIILPTNTPGTSTGLLTSLVFDLKVDNPEALTADLFDYVGLRLQAYGDREDFEDTGEKPGGSLKAWNLGGAFSCPPGEIVGPNGECFKPTTPEIPVPAGLPLMLTAIGIGAYMRKRSRKSA